MDTRRQSASTYVVAAPEFNLCVGVRQHDLLPLAIAQKVLTKLLSCLGAAEPGTGPQLPMLLQWPFQTLKEEGLGVCRSFPKICAARNFLNVTDHHAHPGVLFRFRKTPSLAVPKHHAHPGVSADHAHPGVSADHAHPGVSGVIFGKFCNTFLAW